MKSTTHFRTFKVFEKHVFLIFFAYTPNMPPKKTHLHIIDFVFCEYLFTKHTSDIILVNILSSR